MTSPVITMSTATERTLQDLKAVVIEGLEQVAKLTSELNVNYIKVGSALTEINDRKLYISDGYNTFDEFAEKVFGLKRTNAYNYINAAEAAESVQTSGQTPTLSQSVELAKLEPEKRLEVAKVINFKKTSVRELKEIVAHKKPEAKTARILPKPAPRTEYKRNIEIEAKVFAFLRDVGAEQLQHHPSGVGHEFGPRGYEIAYAMLNVILTLSDFNKFTQMTMAAMQSEGVHKERA